MTYVRPYDERAASDELGRRLSDAEEMIRAIQQGAVDAFVLEELGRHRVYCLEGSDRPYRLFVEQMQQGVATLHSDGTIVYCNRRLTDLLKVPHDELVGGTLAPFVVVDDEPHYQALLEKGRERTARGEIRLRQRDGELLPAYVSFSALPGDCAGMIGAFVTDLTAQKHNERLAAAQEALREADRRKDEFLAMLAHELRGPLAPMSNMLEVMKRAAGDPGTLEEARGTVERQLRHLARLVDDLLDVSRITRNKLELRRERVGLGAICRRVAEAAKLQYASQRHDIVLALPQEPIEVDADEARLTQVFQNLVGNACKYTPAEGLITIAVVAHTGEVAVTVEDSGVGIPSDRLAVVFEPFMQVDRSLERAQGGLGIGLTLVKRLVEMHGGSVEAESDGPGRGSAFTVRLPLPDGHATATARVPQAPKEETTMTSRKFLVVDDNADSAASLAMLLSIEGNETFTAHDGLEAFAAAEKHRPEVVLMDIGLPKLNGFDAAERIRQQPWGKSMTLVALTGWGQEEDRQRSKSAGFDGHLVKPVDFDDLMKLLGELSEAR